MCEVQAAQSSGLFLIRTFGQHQNVERLAHTRWRDQVLQLERTLCMLLTKDATFKYI